MGICCGTPTPPCNAYKSCFVYVLIYELTWLPCPNIRTCCQFTIELGLCIIHFPLLSALAIQIDTSVDVRIHETKNSTPLKGRSHLYRQGFDIDPIRQKVVLHCMILPDTKVFWKVCFSRALKLQLLLHVDFDLPQTCIIDSCNHEVVWIILKRHF